MKIDGVKVMDATKVLRVHITNEDVKGSKRRDPTSCAAAVAIKREQHAHQARVYKSRTYVQMKEGGSWTRYKTPINLLTELVSFDRGASFQADYYALPPLSEGSRLGSYASGGKNKHNKSKKREPMHTLTGVRADAPKGWKTR